MLNEIGKIMVILVILSVMYTFLSLYLVDELLLERESVYTIVKYSFEVIMG
jgi:hypothetical protein